MKGRKCIKYEVKVQYRTGEIEYMQKNDANISSYKDMLKLYNKTKQAHKNDGKIESISFIGVNEYGEQHLFWQKNISITNKKELNLDCRRVVSHIQSEIELLQHQLDHHNDMLKMYDKKEDTILHMIENNKHNSYTSTEEMINFKLKMFDEIENIRSMRRYSKNQIADLNNIIFKLKDLDISPFVKDRVSKSITSDEYKNKTELDAYYTSEKEKLSIIEKYKNKYDKYIIDESSSLIYFYNISTINKYYKNKVNKKLNKNAMRC